MEETSLEDFLDATNEVGEARAAGDAAGDGSAPAGGTEGAGSTDEADAPLPDATSDAVASDGPAVTATWSPAGGTCGECGSRVRRRWAAAGTLVCGDCKEW
jgi:hypothetical protein